MATDRRSEPCRFSIRLPRPRRIGVGVSGANISTTQHYIHLDNRELAEAQDLVE